VTASPARVGGDLAGPPSSWPLWAWDFYRERAGTREAAGESPTDASRNAQEDVRRWRDLRGEESMARRSGDVRRVPRSPP
jgi:hypothetical protein